MDRNFPRALNAVLKHEGGYVNHPNDPGGPTNKGVTLATFRAYVKPTGTVADLKAISDAQVGVVYRRHYWSKVMASDLPGGVDYAVFDFAVNSGPARAAKFLQRALGVVQDGKVGPATIKAAAGADRDGLIDTVCDMRLRWLRTLDTWKTFGKGWTSRVEGVRRLAKKLAAEPDEAPKVVVEKKPVAVTSRALDKPWYSSPDVIVPAVTTAVPAAVPAFAGFDRWVMIVGVVLAAALIVFFVIRRDRQRKAVDAKVEQIEQQEPS
jgi:lysozyme family protein